MMMSGAQIIIHHASLVQLYINPPHRLSEQTESLHQLRVDIADLGAGSIVKFGISVVKSDQEGRIVC
jgi:hypothetical protein